MNALFFPVIFSLFFAIVFGVLRAKTNFDYPIEGVEIKFKDYFKVFLKNFVIVFFIVVIFFVLISYS